MFFPIGDQPNPRGIPIVTWSLIAINVAVHVLVAWPLTMQAADPSDPALPLIFENLRQAYPHLSERALAAEVVRGSSGFDTFLMRWGFLPGAPSLRTLLSAMFLHSGWLHLAGNMLFLWIYGDNVEHRIGRVLYLLAYLATGAAATLAFATFVPESRLLTPLVGASGAISGVLGFYFVWFPHNRVRVFVMLFPFLVDVWLIGARVVLGIYVVVDNVLPLLVSGTQGGVAYGAHLGGFIAGMGGAVAIDALDRLRGRRFGASAEEPHPGPTSRTDADAIVRAIAAGSYPHAVALLAELPSTQRQTIDTEVLADLADALVETSPRAARWVAESTLRSQPHNRASDRLWLVIGQALLHPPSHPTTAYQAFVRALEANPRPEVAAKARHLLQTIAELQRGSFVVPRRGGQRLW